MRPQRCLPEGRPPARPPRGGAYLTRGSSPRRFLRAEGSTGAQICELRFTSVSQPRRGFARRRKPGEKTRVAWRPGGHSPKVNSSPTSELPPGPRPGRGTCPKASFGISSSTSTTISLPFQWEALPMASDFQNKGRELGSYQSVEDLLAYGWMDRSTDLVLLRYRQMAAAPNPSSGYNLNRILRSSNYLKSLIWWCRHLLININGVHINGLHLSKADVRL
ncbi:uncharacterized protein [Manis javanica]|uniref:uncharacterized protein n=1 Tax=Manis javanica TaxID=9974 RepID=UPI0018798872|nr:uncharacterized protein LOC118967990 [Manis javanica]